MARRKVKTDEWYAKRGCYHYTPEEVSLINALMETYDIGIAFACAINKYLDPEFEKRCYSVSRYIEPIEEGGIPVFSTARVSITEED